MYNIVDETKVELEKGEYTYHTLLTIIDNMEHIAEKKKDDEYYRLCAEVPENCKLENCGSCYRYIGYRNLETDEVEYFDVDCDCSYYR